MIYIKQKTTTKGFALLYTVVIVSLILSITAGISNIIFKQAILASLATDSQVAFYQADSAVECGMYLLNTDTSFDITTPPDPFTCANTQNYEVANVTGTRVEYKAMTGTDTAPCAEIVIDTTNPQETLIEGHGFNICDSTNPRHIERVLEVRY